MKILVIGGSGFLGSFVADFLSDDDHQVTIMDINKSQWIRKDQKMVQGDILDEKLVTKLIKENEIVYLFASLADIDLARHNPIQTVKTNVLGAVNVIDACVKHGIKRLIFASTVYVYSNEGSFYKCSKQAVESYIEEYSRVYNLKFTIFRYGSLYGPRADEGNGMLNILKNAKKNGFLSYQGNKDAEREYIHIYDAAKASCLPVKGKFENESIVLTGNEKTKMIDLLQMISEMLGIKKDIKFSNKKYVGHYIKTPYAYQPKLGSKYIPNEYVDLGQGILDLYNSINDD